MPGPLAVHLNASHGQLAVHNPLAQAQLCDALEGGQTNRASEAVSVVLAQLR